jgi:hypothetical protein
MNDHSVSPIKVLRDRSTLVSPPKNASPLSPGFETGTTEPLSCNTSLPRIKFPFRSLKIAPATWALRSQTVAAATARSNLQLSVKSTGSLCVFRALESVSAFSHDKISRLGFANRIRSQFFPRPRYKSIKIYLGFRSQAIG